MLLAAGADVNNADAGGNTALMQAAGGGHAAVMRALLTAGADPDKANAVSNTPPLLAAWRGEACRRKYVELHFG